MPVSRRTLLSAPLIPAGLTMPLQALGQGTPDATPEGEPLPPEAIFEQLLASEIATPLFPSDITGLTVKEWVDTNDTDLEGAIGGVMVQAGVGGDARPVGAYIVHPTFEAAGKQIAPEGSPEASVLWYDAAWYSMDGTQASDPEESFAVIAVQSGTVIVSAFAEGAGTPGNDLRALANLAGLLDHLNGITSNDHND